jgi:hypothetical protein
VSEKNDPLKSIYDLNCAHIQRKDDGTKPIDNVLFVTFAENKYQYIRINESQNDTLLYQLSDGLRPRHLRINEQHLPKKKIVLVTKVAQKKVIARAPGFGFCRFLGHFCPKDFREEVLDALHADVIADYQATLASGDHTRARMIGLMMYVWMVRSIAGGIVGWVFEKLAGRVVSGSGD